MPTIRRILVPVDFSACSRAALDYAAFLGERFGAAIDVLHVWEPPGYVGPEVMINVPGRTGLPLVEFARTEAGREMEKFLAALEERKIVEVNGRLETGMPVNMILSAAADRDYDLIVMGTHGRTGFMGSVTERVVRRAPCPVLTLRAPA
jgi:nucleotide-binding universal stress UspA family protein